MPGSVTARDGFGGRGIGGGSRPQYPLPPAQHPPTPAGCVAAPRVIHMLINAAGRSGATERSLGIAGGYWQQPGGYWDASETRNTRRFDLVEPQVTASRRVLAGIGGCSFEVFTSETYSKGHVHVFADPRFSIPANTRLPQNGHHASSRDVHTQAGDPR